MGYLPGFSKSDACAEPPCLHGLAAQPPPDEIELQNTGDTRGKPCNLQVGGLGHSAAFPSSSACNMQCLADRSLAFCKPKKPSQACGSPFAYAAAHSLIRKGRALGGTWTDPCCPQSVSWRYAMLDLLFVVITVVFFSVAWAYVRGCERV